MSGGEVAALVAASGSGSQAVQEGSGAVGSVLDTLKKLVHTELSSTMGDRVNGVGFREWHQTSQVWASRVKSSTTAAADVMRLAEKFSSHMKPEDYRFIQTTLAELGTERYDARHAMGEFHFVSPRGDGFIFLFAIDEIVHRGQPAYSVYVVAGTVGLVPAPDYCIMTESKSGFFSSRTSQSIREFPIALKQEHLEHVMRQLSGTQLVGYLRHLSALDGGSTAGMIAA